MGLHLKSHYGIMKSHGIRWWYVLLFKILSLSSADVSCFGTLQTARPLCFPLLSRRDSRNIRWMSKIARSYYRCHRGRHFHHPHCHPYHQMVGPTSSLSSSFSVVIKNLQWYNIISMKISKSLRITKSSPYRHQYCYHQYGQSSICPNINMAKHQYCNHQYGQTSIL